MFRIDIFIIVKHINYIQCCLFHSQLKRFHIFSPLELNSWFDSCAHTYILGLEFCVDKPLFFFKNNITVFAVINLPNFVLSSKFLADFFFLYVKVLIKKVFNKQTVLNACTQKFYRTDCSNLPIRTLFSTANCNYFCI